MDIHTRSFYTLRALHHAAAVALALGAAACSDSPLATPSAAPRLSAARDGTKQENAAFLARAFAIALGDSVVRRAVQAHLASSRATEEHKLDLSAYTRGAGRALLTRAAATSGTSVQQIQAALDALPPLEFYMPVASHRNRWTGMDEILVAASMDPKTVVAYDKTGAAVPVSATSAPTRPTLVLVPSETNFERAIPSSVTNAVRVPGAIGTLQTPYQQMLHSTDRPSLVPCDEACNGGGPITIPAPLGPDPTATGLYLRQMQIWDKAEPWSRGDPEIEVHVLGTQPNFYYLTNQSVTGGGGTLTFSNNPTTIPFACAGAQAAVPAAKRFDYNGEGGAVYSNTVLLAGLTEFARRETVQPRGSLAPVKDRKVPLGPPFIIDVWERDDGAECPSPTSQYVASNFRVGVKLTFNPNGGYNIWRDTTKVEDLKRLFGIIENSNDFMGSWTFSSWDAFEHLTASSVYTSAYVYIKFTNNGVNRNNVPAAQDPFTSW